MHVWYTVQMNIAEIQEKINKVKGIYTEKDIYSIMLSSRGRKYIPVK